MKRVYVSGSYDILNCGHVQSFRDIKKKYPGCHLTVGLNTDSLMMEHKGKVIIPFAQRAVILKALRDVDEVVGTDSPDALRILQWKDIDVFATVPEWVERQKESIDWIESKGGEVYLLKYYPEDGEILSSSQIRERVKRSA